MKNKNLKIAAITSGSIVLILVLYFTVFKGIILAQPEIGLSKPPVEMNATVKALNDAYKNAANAVIESVVNIRVKIKSKRNLDKFDIFPFQDENPFFKDWEDFLKRHFEDVDPEMTSAGSGVFVTSDGYIVTNNHVIENADEIKVTTFNKKEYKAKIIGSDKWTDLAVIKIEGENFKPVHFANMDEIKVGELVIAVGNPLGLSSTVTSGIISALGRGGLNLIRPEDGGKVNYAIENFIQTDAPINPGNSGGGLFNLNGSLVGINTAIATRTGTYIGYGFAIPADLVKTVVTEIIRTGKFDRAYLGVYIRTVDETYAKAFGLKEVKGAFVNEVEKGSPADKAGVKIEDVILAVDGKTINSSNELQTEIAKRKPGETVELTIWRQKKEIKIKVKLGTKDGTFAENEQQSEIEEPKPGQEVKLDKLGLVVTPLDEKTKEAFDVKNGVYIKDVKNSYLRRERGLIPGGVILKVDEQEITSVNQLKKIIEAKKPGEAVLLRIKYKDTSTIVAIEVPES
ncbi:MAG: Do family serine endopeptidase [Ignavibacteria bacterium]|nr:Do family serine endopeptidase [Ignavibacteria bacterium]